MVPYREACSRALRVCHSPWCAALKRSASAKVSGHCSKKSPPSANKACRESFVDFEARASRLGLLPGFWSIITAICCLPKSFMAFRQAKSWPSRATLKLTESKLLFSQAPLEHDTPPLPWIQGLRLGHGLLPC